MRVLVDAVSARVGGGGTYALAQLPALARIEDIDVTIYATGELADELGRHCPDTRIVRRPPRGVLVRTAWEQFVLPFRALSHDVLYMPGNFALFLAPRPQALTLQNAWYFGDDVRSFRRRRCTRRRRFRVAVESAIARASIRRADVTIAVSESMRRAVTADLGDRANAVPVVSSAAGAPSTRCSEQDLPALQLPDTFVLSVAHDDPHKDWDGLIDTFLSAPNLPPLAVVGRCSAARRSQLETRIDASGSRERVTLLGMISDRRLLQDLYGRAACCVVHSYFESYGLTAAEALSAGTRVVASDIAAHREICGAAALYYPPSDLEALADAVRRGLAGPRPQSALSGRGRTWNENAEELAAILRELGKRRPARRRP